MQLGYYVRSLPEKNNRTADSIQKQRGDAGWPTFRIRQDYEATHVINSHYCFCYPEDDNLEHIL